MLGRQPCCAHRRPGSGRHSARPEIRYSLPLRGGPGRVVGRRRPRASLDGHRPGVHRALDSPLADPPRHRPPHRPGAACPDRVLDTFMRALPHTLRRTPAPIGAQVQVIVAEGSAGGTWTATATADRWSLAERPTNRSHAAGHRNRLAIVHADHRACRGSVPRPCARRSSARRSRVPDRIHHLLTTLASRFPPSLTSTAAA